jgi:CheY-like chemotaxis protein
MISREGGTAPAGAVLATGQVVLSRQRWSGALLMTSNRALASSLLRDLRRLGQTGVSVDSCEVALEMMGAAEFALVIVDVDAPGDWWTCQRLVQSKRAPVAILTRFVAPDRRYRRWAFAAGVSAYMCKPCTTSRLRRMLSRMRRGDLQVEVVEGTAYCECI